MSKSQFKAAVAGLGSISPVHIKALDDIGKQITAVCDSNPDIANPIGKERGCRTYTDYEAMISQGGFEVLHICLPHYLHAPAATLALNKGIHVICEKPMATTIEDAEKMISAAEASSAKLEIIFQNRYNTSTQSIKKALESGELGKVHGGHLQVTWNRSEAYYTSSNWRGRWATEGGGVLINQAIHTFDLMNYFLGKPTAVNGSAANRTHPFIEVEDVAEGVISYGDINVSFYATNNYPYNAPVSIEIICEKGRAVLSGDAATIIYNDGQEKTSKASDKESMPYRKDYWGYSHIKQIQGFYDGLMGAGTARVCGGEGLITQRLINGIYASSKTGQKVIF